MRHIAVDDAGRILNPLLADGQRHGGIAQGVAQALLEEVRYDEDGNPVTSNLADYAAISATELPSFELVAMETPTDVNPLGAKGIGESGTIGSTPAVQSAVVDALAHLGVRHLDMPASPERVWRAIQCRRRHRMTRPIEAEGLVRRFGDVVAVDGVDLMVDEGEIFGFLGPNGAGKSTIVRMLTTLLKPTAGPGAGGRLRRGRGGGSRPARHRCGAPGRRHRPADDGPRAGAAPGRAPRHLAVGRRPARRRAARAGRSHRRRRPAGRHLLRRHAPPTRPGAVARARAVGAVPRRADHRPRPHQPHSRCGRRSAGSTPTAPPCSSPRSTSRRPTSWPARVAIIDNGRIVREGSRRRSRPASVADTLVVTVGADHEVRGRRGARPVRRADRAAKTGSVAIGIDGGAAALVRRAARPRGGRHRGGARRARRAEPRRRVRRRHRPAARGRRGRRTERRGRSRDHRRRRARARRGPDRLAPGAGAGAWAGPTVDPGRPSASPPCGCPACCSPCSSRR